MGCGSGYETKNIEDKKCQDLSGWTGTGLTLETLRSKLLGGDISKDVYVYTVYTTRLDKNLKVVRHLGSGPNLEGGLATLCTCKHSMRKYHTCEDWKDRWILGLTSRDKKHGFNDEHYLFYMMKIEKAFESHKELYEYLDTEQNRKFLQIKNVVNNRLGDIFEPKSTCTCTNSLDPMMYKKPIENHSHAENGHTDWYDDIAYTPLLLGDKNKTFVWTQPMIIFTQDRGVGNKKLTIEDLFREGEGAFLKACK